MDCPGGLGSLIFLSAFLKASTLVLMDCPGGRLARRGQPVRANGFNPCFNGLSRRTYVHLGVHRDLLASTLVLMDCPGGRSLKALGESVGLLQPLF